MMAVIGHDTNNGRGLAPAKAGDGRKASGAPARDLYPAPAHLHRTIDCGLR